MHTFFTSPSQMEGNTAWVDGETAHHISRVLRMRKGEAVRVTDGSRLWSVTVLQTGEQVTFQKVNDLQPPPKPKKLSLFVSLLKKEKLEWLVEKAVELNIERIVFVKTQHSVRLDLSNKQKERFIKIATQAQIQCGRLVPLILEGPIDWNEALNLSKNTSNFMCDEVGNHPYFRNQTSQSANFWIGPEGGFSDAERLQATEETFVFVTLSPLILRAETAALLAMSHDL